MNLDPRLPKPDQLRHHIRRNDHTKARALAHRLIEEGAEWLLVDADGGAQVDACGMLDVFAPLKAERWIEVADTHVHACWDMTRAKLFACACAASALPLYEEREPGDSRRREAISLPLDEKPKSGDGRLREAIAVARRYALPLSTPLGKLRFGSQMIADRKRARRQCERALAGRLGVMGPISPDQRVMEHVAVSVHAAVKVFDFSFEYALIGNAALSATRAHALASGARHNDEVARCRAIFRDTFHPLMIRHMLLPIEELTRFEEEDA